MCAGSTSSRADSCADLLAGPADVASPPPLDLVDICLYESSLNIGLWTINNYDVVGVAETAEFDLEGAVFNNIGDFAVMGDRDSYLGFESELAGSLFISGSDPDISPTVGRFINTGELYAGEGALIVISTTGSLEGDGGDLTNFGMLYNAGQANLLLKFTGEGARGTVDNSGEVINEAQWYADSVINQQGSITNLQNADWTIGRYLANDAGSVFDNEGSIINQGIFENFATVNNSGHFSNLGEVYLQNGSMNLAGGHIDNLGSLTDSPLGRLVTNGSGSIENHGSFDLRSSIDVDSFENHAGVANIGRNLRAQSLVNDGGALTVNGSIRVGQSMQLSNGSVSADLIDMGTTGTMEFTGGVLQVNTFIGDLLNQGGRLAPGMSPGATVITGDYQQLAGASFEVEIGGLLQGVQYDWLDVSGTATLDGTLEILLYDFGSGPFVPSLGDSFDILSAETIIGEFDSFSLALLNDEMHWNIEYILDDVGTDYVRLVVSAVPVPAAVWLFGTALVGFIGVSRRRKVAYSLR